MPPPICPAPMTPMVLISIASPPLRQKLPFNNQRDALAPTQAECGKPSFYVSLLHGVQQRGEDPGAAAPDWVPEGHCPAMDVDPGFVEAQLPDDRHGGGGKGLIDLEEVYCIYLQTRLGHYLGYGLDRGNQDILQRQTGRGLGHDPGHG